MITESNRGLLKDIPTRTLALERGESSPTLARARAGANEEATRAAAGTPFNGVKAGDHLVQREIQGTKRVAPASGIAAVSGMGSVDFTDNLDAEG